MPDPPLLVLALALVLAGATFQGTTGFGFNILVVPFLVLFINPKVVVPTVVLHSLLINLAILATGWRFVTIGRIWLLLLAGAIGAPFGVFLQSVFDPGPLRLLIGLVVVLTGLSMLAGYRRFISNEHLAAGFAGSVGGTMSGLIGMSGPPVLLLFANQGMPAGEFRSNIVSYFTVVAFVAIGAFWLDGALTDDVLELALATIPATVLGVFMGIRLHSHVSLELLHRMSLVLVILAGTTALIAGVLSL